MVKGVPNSGPDEKDVTRLRIGKDTRDNGLRPLKRDGEIWDTVVRRLIDYYEKHEGEERYATPDDVREIVREELDK